MKLTIISSLLLSSAIATAQTANAPAAQAAQATQAQTMTQQQAGKPAQVQASKKVKKAKKNQQKADVKTSQSAPVVAPAAVVVAASPAVMTQTPATNTATTAEVAPAPAAATSTASAAAAAPTKKWGVSLVSELALDNANGEGIKNISKASVDTTSYLGATYKVTATEKIGARQYFTYRYTPDANSTSDDIKQGFTTVTFATKTKGVLGSDEIAPSFMYYLPGDVAEKNALGQDLEHFYGILRMDAEVAWTINPKWSVSYYANPRQTLGAKQGNFQATSRLIHYGFIYYNLNDNVQFYGDAGFDHRMASESLTSTSDDALSAIGANITMFGGKFILNPEISNTVPLKQSGQYVKSPRWLQSEDMSYALTTVIAL